MASICRFKDKDCHKCKKRGQIAKVCRSIQLSKMPRKQTKTRFVHQDFTCVRTTDVSEEQQEQKEDSYIMFTTRDTAQQNLLLLYICLLNDVPTDMEFNMGASLSVINQTTYSQISRGDRLQKTEVKLKTYTGESIPVIGSIKVHVKHKGQEEVIPVLVVEGQSYGKGLALQDQSRHVENSQPS